MNSETSSNIVRFPGQHGPDQNSDPHRDVIVTLAHLMRQMNGLVNSINKGSIEDNDKIKYNSWLCEASTLCLRTQLNYFEQFCDRRALRADATPLGNPLPPGGSP